MKYNTDPYDPDRVAPEAYDDRDEKGLNIDEQDAFNQPSDKVAHL